MEFEWDEAKRVSNLAKHGVDFVSVAGSEWSTAVVREDRRRSYGERRWSAQGMIDARLHTLVFVVRGERVRVISLRAERKGWPMTKTKVILPTPEEDAVINRGIAEDPDTWEWTDEDFAQARPAREVFPEIVADYERRTRGAQKRPTKVLVSLRLEREVVERLRASGRGWQSRVNDMLRKAVLGR